MWDKLMSDLGLTWNKLSGESQEFTMSNNPYVKYKFTTDGLYLIDECSDNWNWREADGLYWYGILSGKYGDVVKLEKEI